RFGRGWWLRWRSRRAQHSGADPVRREAGRWLRRLAERESTGSGTAAALAVVRRDLERLRYGPRATWPNPQTVFRQARVTLRRASNPPRPESRRR
ncbi:MAG TPA: hypothetical protein VGD81_05285, partial [Opitutaceae bacterium]